MRCARRIAFIGALLVAGTVLAADTLTPPGATITVRDLVETFAKVSFWAFVGWAGWLTMSVLGIPAMKQRQDDLHAVIERLERKLDDTLKHGDCPFLEKRGPNDPS